MTNTILWNPIGMWRSRGEAFLVDCNDLCDVSTVDALERTNDQDVKRFLEMQRQKNRPGSMKSILAKAQEGGPGPSSSNSNTNPTATTPSADNSNQSSVRSFIESSRELSSLSSISLVDDSVPNSERAPATIENKEHWHYIRFQIRSILIISPSYFKFLENFFKISNVENTLWKSEHSIFGLDDEQP